MTENDDVGGGRGWEKPYNKNINKQMCPITIQPYKSLDSARMRVAPAVSAL
jgi:hypothetical protein